MEDPQHRSGDRAQEAEAIARLKRGDAGGLAVLVRRYQVPAVRAACLVTRDRALAEDIVQAAFVRAYERIGFTGRSCALSLDYDDFRLIEFDNITSSIFIPAGAGWSRYYEHPYYGQPDWAFQASVDDLRPIGCNDMISSAERMGY